MSSDQTNDLFEPPPGSIRVERNLFFTGKVMTARDFTDEQLYFLSAQRLHTRLFHGWGIRCGLAVDQHPNPDCRSSWVVLRKGIAVDCYGRLLVVPNDIPVKLPFTPTNPPAPGSGGVEVTPPYFLCLRYAVEKAEFVPALYAESTCDPYRTDASRVREVAEAVFLTVNQLPAGCWKTAPVETPAPAPAPVVSYSSPPEYAAEANTASAPPKQASPVCQPPTTGADPCGDGTGCLDASCPCGAYIPLAFITPDEANGGGQPTIDQGGRRYLIVHPRKTLTHIDHTNWKHGRVYTFLQFKRIMKGRLLIHFDRPLQRCRGMGTGITRHTLIVQYGEHGILRLLPSDPKSPPYLWSDGQWAVFRIDRRYLRRRDGLAHRLLGTTIHVTLKCDFIPDSCGIAVDGDHLRGRLPSGDDVEGGTFESWFLIRDEGDTGDYGDDDQAPAYKTPNTGESTGSGYLSDMVDNDPAEPSEPDASNKESAR